LGDLGLSALGDALGDDFGDLGASLSLRSSFLLGDFDLSALGDLGASLSLLSSFSPRFRFLVSGFLFESVFSSLATDFFSPHRVQRKDLVALMKVS